MRAAGDSRHMKWVGSRPLINLSANRHQNRFVTTLS